MEILSQLDIWRLLAGLGIFLFGMFMMEESIKLLAGRSFKKLIRRSTNTRVKGIFSGMISTAILQSSSAVSLMVLAFAGAGLMKLGNAFAVMIGSKVGTTMTAWIVALFGFKFQIESFALPMIAIGGLGLVLLANSPRYVNISKLLVGFGFLFHGLDFMKSSVEDLAMSVDFTTLPEMGLWFYALLGLVLTAVMQSSSATIAISLTMLHSGVVGFDASAAMVIGANVGTTVTVILGAIGGIPIKKQAALSQLMFTTGTAIVTFIILSPLSYLVLKLFAMEESIVLALALFHTLFNVMGVLMFYPLVPAIARFAERKIPEPPKLHLTRYIDNTSPEISEAAIEALRKECINQAKHSLAFVEQLYKVGPAANQGKVNANGGVRYNDIERMHAEIFAYYAQIQGFVLEEPEVDRLEPYIRASRSIMNATLNLYKQHSEIEDYKREDNKFMQGTWGRFTSRLVIIHQMVEKVNQEPDADHALLLKETFRQIEEADKGFIKECAEATGRWLLKEEEVTRLLMSNRLFTQSCRMLSLSLESLNSYSEEAPSDTES